MLNHKTLLLIQTQEELNLLAECIVGIEVDALHINEDYVAYIEEVVWVVPLSEIDDTHFMKNIKLTPFKKWYKKQKRS